MAQGGNRYRVIGDYVVGQQIGSGSFAVVWRSRHRHHGYEVAIKEIATEKLSKKLRASLFLEIEILRQINHPNIIRLHEIVEAPGRIYLVLEYCTGGDLAAYIQRYGRVSEVIGRHFMSQLAAGLQVLREKNLIHRDLKPQNLLLSTNDRNAVLKIADFGFARSLQPQGLAETLCGSPLYMAPEIMQNQKYDAKADLWSVGVILFQLVTGSPPFSGNSQYQLLENIMRSNDLHFPPDVIGDLHPDCIDLCRRLLRRNPVERLSFEEFFNHKFMVQARPVGGPHNTSAGSGGNPFTHFQNASLESGGSPVSKTAKGSQDDCLPFGLDDDQHAHVASSSFSSKKNLFSDSFSSGFPDNNVLVSQNFSMKDSPIANEVQSDKPEADTNLPYTSSRYKLRRSFDSRPEEVSLLEGFQAADVEQELVNTTPSKGVADSLECIEQEYVLVNAHAASTETLSFSLGASGLDQPPGKLVSSPTERIQKSTSAPVQIVGTAVGSLCGVESLGSHGSIPSGTSQASVDLGDVLDRPSVHPPTRLLSLQKYAYSITELAMEKLVAGHQLEAFSIQLVCLAIWKKAMYVSHSWAAASTEGNSSQEVLVNTRVMPAEADYQGAAAACSQMEQEFLIAVEHAENLSSYLGPLDGNAEMPDAMEIIFQRALALGIKGLVDQFIGQLDNAATSYSKSTTLLSFILVEATCLDLNPPFQLSPPDRQRLRRYIDSLTTHQNQSIADRMALVQPQSQRSL